MAKESYLMMESSSHSGNGDSAYAESSFDPENATSDVDFDELENMLESDGDDHSPTSNTGTGDGSGEAEEAPSSEGGGSLDNAESDEFETGLEITKGFDESILEADRENMPNENEANLLDAYYAEFGDPATVALLKARPELQEVVIGADDRVRVTNTKKYPWRTICSLLITAKDGSRWIGTGWLAGPRLVVTAGHCVYLHSRGGWAKSIEVIPGRNGSSRPYGSCKSSAFYSVKGWTGSRKRSHDYGAIVLPSNCKYGKKLGYFGFTSQPAFRLINSVANLSGYPGDKPAGTQWWHARKIKAVTSRTLLYNIDTYGGQSGSPVWWYRNGKRYAIGIHTNGHPSGNSATRIVKPVFNNIRNWRNAHP